MNDTNPVPAKKMEILEKESHPLSSALSPRRKKALELGATGLTTFVLAWLVGMFAPLAIGLYGAYRMASKRRWKEGAIWMIAAVGLYLLMPLFTMPLFFIKLTGFAILSIGVVLFFKPSKSTE